VTAGDLPRVERTEDGHALWIHECTDASFNPAEALLPTEGSNGWRWSDDGGLTPSILCHNCGTHGFWVGGDVPCWRAC
jgi:hypothetical protein